METRFCPGCRDERIVEQPPCADGHEDCPEWVCSLCGAAFVLGWLQAEAVPARTGGRRGRSSAA
jgi:hypothetical protein